MQGIEELIRGAIQLAILSQEIIDVFQCCLLIQALGGEILAEVLACYIQQRLTAGWGGHLDANAAAMKGWWEVAFAI
jgi:hypothetical protein